MDNAAGCCKACLKKAEEETKLWEDDDLDDDFDDLDDLNDLNNLDDVEDLDDVEIPEEWKNLSKEELDQKIADLMSNIKEKISKL